MTNSWTDIKNADVVMVIGSNTAENHPLGFKHIEKAMDKGATLINVDPRFCRSSAKAHIHAFMRSGTDIAFIGGMIKYAIDHGLYNERYVKECTNALLKVDTSFETCAEGTLGVFSGFTAGTYDANLEATLDSTYNKASWNYDVPLAPNVAADLDDPDCVFQKLKKQYENYTVGNVCSITGTNPVVYEEICKTYCSTYPDDKSATIMYAMGTTQHTVGTQNVRSYAILQLLLGNVGVAGGGINALRGQDNVQGATDQCVLNHILPGYLKVPTPSQATLADYKADNYTAAQKVQPVAGQPSLHWWQHGAKYIDSLLKAWWPTLDPAVSYNYLSKKTADYSILTMFDEMYKGNITGAIFDGENPAVSDPDSNHVRAALGHLDWLVCVDPFETETAAFWKRPGVDPATINTTVYLLPSSVALEKWGSRSNSGRWVQWHWQGGTPPGEARSDMDFLVDLGQRLKTALSGDPAMANLNWPCFNYTSETGDALAELIAKEMHGYNMSGSTPGTLVTNFVGLSEDGTTACGNWLHSGMFAPALDSFEDPNQGAIWPAGGVGNRAKRRYSPDVCHLGPANDPLYATNQIGLYSYWAWCWPINRRIVYNRASTVQGTGGGAPLAPHKYVIRWEEGSWRGDMWDGGAGPGLAAPFIMTKDGLGHLFGGWTVAEGPFPWHYEPLESPIAYPSWLGQGTGVGSVRMNPMVHNFGASYAPHNGGDDTTYPIFATSYRLTEHWHTGAMTRNLPRLNELQPEPFVEMSEELATAKGIVNGDLVNIGSARGTIQMKACVTKRFKPFQVEGKTVHQVGIIWHWGFMGLSTGDSGNVVTPFIGDANTRIQESKAFRVNIVKV
ncbi:MAG: molybdopterin-dependent oxidoreductase [Dehalococcoidia bacterium]|nr:molybdopterin-dependent oxidoreductase [Dehalococcoidia bacterium]